jgi:hypothetical protein
VVVLLVPPEDAGAASELLAFAGAEVEGELLAAPAGEAALVEVAGVVEAAGVVEPAVADSLDLLFFDFFVVSVVVAAVAPVSEVFDWLDLLASVD